MEDKPQVPHLRPVPADGAVEGALAIDPAQTHDGITAPSQRGTTAGFLTDVIVNLGFAARERVDSAVDVARQSGRTPEQVLLEDGVMNEAQLPGAVAARSGLAPAALPIYPVDRAGGTQTNPTAARRYQAVPIHFVDESTLLVAMADPTNVLA